MADRIDVASQVALAALLDTNCLGQAMLRAELFDDAPFAGDGATELVASDPTVSRLVMAAVVSSAPRVRATVAARPDLDAVLYPMLASDPERCVRERVAANRAAPGAVVDHLTRDVQPSVREAAVSELRRRSFPTAHAS